MLFLQVGLQNALHCATLSPWSQEGTPRVVKLPPRPKTPSFSRYRKLML